MTDRRRSSSPCLNLDELSSSDDDTVGSVCLSDLSVTLLCGSDDGHTPVNSDQVISDVDLPPETVSNDKRQIIQIRDVSPDVQIVDIYQFGRAWDSRRTVSKGGSGKRAAKYMTAMGRRPRTGPGDPRPVPASSCNACMTCNTCMTWYCFPEDRLPPEKCILLFFFFFSHVGSS